MRKVNIFALIKSKNENKTFILTKDNKENCYISKIDKYFMYLEELNINTLSDFKNDIYKYVNNESEYMIAEFNKDIKIENEEFNKISIFKEDLLESNLKYTYKLDNVYYYISNDKNKIKNNKINGYLKFFNINYFEDNTMDFNIYIETTSNEFYKISLSYLNCENINNVFNFNAYIEKINIQEIINEGDFFLPKNLETVSIPVDKIEGIFSYIGCKIGNVLEFDDAHVNIFENEMIKSNYKDIINALIMNKEHFENFINEKRKESLQNITIKNDIIDTLLQLENIKNTKKEYSQER